MIIKILWGIAVIYLIGFIVVCAFHIIWLPMVTPPLAFLRALVWPYFWITGQPHGEPFRMDQ